MHKLYTVTEIAEAICRADGLRLSDHATAHSQVRNAVRRGGLQGGVQVDARGTQAFPALEVYRARLLNALADLSIDISFALPVLAEADRESKPSPLTDNWPPRMKVEAGWLSKGGFRDAVEGIAAGEQWSLCLALYRPGHLSAKRVVARYVWHDDPDSERHDRDTWIEDSFGTGAPQATMTVNLTDLFQRLPPLDL